MEEKNIREAAELFLESVKYSRSENTEHTYRNGINAFLAMLSEQEIKETDPVALLTVAYIGTFAKYLKLYAPSTESLYIGVAKHFYEFLEAENMGDFNLYKAKLLIKNRSRKQGVRLPQFPKDDITKVLEYAQNLPTNPCETETDRLINLRDAAFLITLADTGLRVHEACALRVGSINLQSKKAIIIGKGDKQAVVRFSDRSINMLHNYLLARGELDGSSGRMLASLPLFARHDKGAGKKIEPISTKTGRMIVSNHVRNCLGEEAVGTITPHSFRHYFVTNVLQQTGNLKIAQEFARHNSITVTQRYAHLVDNELDDTYDAIFND